VNEQANLGSTTGVVPWQNRPVTKDTALATHIGAYMARGYPVRKPNAMDQ
jgi:hypothetical protein